MRKPKFTHTCIDERSEEPQVVGKFWLRAFWYKLFISRKNSASFLLVQIIFAKLCRALFAYTKVCKNIP